jgi:hypothetical protein
VQSSTPLGPDQVNVLLLLTTDSSNQTKSENGVPLDQTKSQNRRKKCGSHSSSVQSDSEDFSRESKAFVPHNLPQSITQFSEIRFNG